MRRSGRGEEAEDRAIQEGGGLGAPEAGVAEHVRRRGGVRHEARGNSCAAALQAVGADSCRQATGHWRKDGATVVIPSHVLSSMQCSYYYPRPRSWMDELSSFKAGHNGVLLHLSCSEMQAREGGREGRL